MQYSKVYFLPMCFQLNLNKESLSIERFLSYNNKCELYNFNLKNMFILILKLFLCAKDTKLNKNLSKRLLQTFLKILVLYVLGIK